MREILFKAQKLYNNEWVEGNLVIDNCGIPHIVKNCFFEYGHHFTYNNYTDKSDLFKRKTICQYTGLTDKNGNKIWENDIVAIPGEDERFLVEWGIEQAAFVIESDTLQCDFDNYRGTDLEVIGNVFDNPDLLKESEE